MNQLMKMTTELTMSSREIADLTSKEHGHVKRDIEVMIQQLSGDVSKFGCIYFDSMNRKQTEYRLDRRHVDCLLTGYSAMLRMKVIDRWQELETAQKSTVPRTYAHALLEAGRLALENERQAEMLAIAAPKVAFVDRYVERKTLQTATQVANTLGLPSAIALNRELDRIGGIYDKRVKRGRAFCSDWLDGGFGEVKQGELGFSSALFTPAGIERLAEILKN